MELLRPVLYRNFEGWNCFKKTLLCARQENEFHSMIKSMLMKKEKLGFGSPSFQ